MEQISLDRRGPVALVTITNPPMGFMNGQTLRELLAVMDEIEVDPTVRAMVFTGGVPGVFIRHYDVAEIVATGEALQASPAGLPRAEDMQTHQLFNRVEACPKPSIAAINGLCMGGGYEFALACDIRLAAHGAYSIGLPEMRVGIFPGAGGTQRLARLIGPGAALNAILRGLVFTPQEAEARGLVHERVSGDVVGEALRVAQNLAQKPPSLLAAVKKLVRAAPATPLAEGLEAEWEAFGRILMESNEAVDTMKAFVEDGVDLSKW